MLETMTDRLSIQSQNLHQFHDWIMVLNQSRRRSKPSGASIVTNRPIQKTEPASRHSEFAAQRLVQSAHLLDMKSNSTNVEFRMTSGALDEFPVSIDLSMIDDDVPKCVTTLTVPDCEDDLISEISVEECLDCIQCDVDQSECDHTFVKPQHDPPVTPITVKTSSTGEAFLTVNELQSPGENQSGSLINLWAITSTPLEEEIVVDRMSSDQHSTIRRLSHRTGRVSHRSSPNLSWGWEDPQERKARNQDNTRHDSDVERQGDAECSSFDDFKMFYRGNFSHERTRISPVQN
jgi:hypothetical protein